MVILEEEENWETARKLMLNLDFLPNLRKITKDSITTKMNYNL